MEIQNWMRGIGFPESLAQIYCWQNEPGQWERPENSDMNLYSDGTLIVHTSNNNFNYQIRFRSMFPYRLGELAFDATKTDEEYFTADVSFKYLIYNVLDCHGNYLPYRYS